jgi:prolyl-tRNA synthetase
LKGVPLRLEIGAMEVEGGQIKAVRRDNLEKGSVDRNSLGQVSEMLEAIQSSLLAKSRREKEDLTAEAATYEEFKDVLSRKKMFVRVLWCEEPECETQIKADTKAVSRVLELDRIDQHQEGVCFHCGKPASRKWLFAQSY